MKSPNHPLPSLEFLHSILEYNELTGILTYRVKYKRNTVVGKPLGCPNQRGYLRFSIDRVFYYVHRVCYYMATGINPGDLDIDHEDGITKHNWKSNLRLATKSENMHNSKKSKVNTSGVKGVSWREDKKAFSARVKVNRKNKFLGYYRLLEHAEEAVREYREELHKEFTNHG